MNYKEYRDKRQEEFNALPIFYAFSDKQFAQAMHERGLKATDADKVYRLGMGGYYLRSDAEIIRAYFKAEEIQSLMKDPTWAQDAFYEEMCDHEYGINWQADWDVCSCFCNCSYAEWKTYVEYLHEGGYTEDVIEAYRLAKKQYAQAAVENDWF